MQAIAVAVTETVEGHRQTDPYARSVRHDPSLVIRLVLITEGGPDTVKTDDAQRSPSSLEILVSFWVSQLLAVCLGVLGVSFFQGICWNRMNFL